MTAFNTGLPSIRLVQHLIRDKKQVEIKLLTADAIVGQIRWQDDNCICIVDRNEQTYQLWRGAIAYIKPLA